jgi:hypothetical protein
MMPVARPDDRKPTDRTQEQNQSERTTTEKQRTPSTSEHYYVCERVGDAMLVHNDSDTADDASRDVVNRRKVGGQRNFFVLNVHHVNTDDDDDENTA